MSNRDNPYNDFSLEVIMKAAAVAEHGVPTEKIVALIRAAKAEGKAEASTRRWPRLHFRSPKGWF